MRAREKLSYALSTARGVTIEYDLEPYRRIVREIRKVDLSAAADEELTRTARRTAEAGLVPFFALAVEACRRRLGMDPFDEQLIAAIAMHHGKLAQMQTGEGKTLAAVFPAALRGFEGRGVHVLTANDYLAARDARWMGPVYELLGLCVSAVGERTPPAERMSAYAADVTYLTAREAGFDHLRDGLCVETGAMVQPALVFGAPGLAMAIVDEADFILIDEARVPLVIAGADTGDGIDLRRVDELAAGMTPGLDFTVDREGRRVSLTLAGHARVEDGLGVPGMHDEHGAPAFARVYAALHARHLLRRDVDYVVKGGRVELVDEFTGRIADRRQWPWGVQAALEAREGLSVRAEGRVYGSITIRHFMGLYDRMAAMTATAVSAAEELSEAYGLGTVVIPPVKTVRRIDHPDLVFRTGSAKMGALLREIGSVHATGRPVLVGTASVRESEELSELLRRSGVTCTVLNAKNDEAEAELISRAGRLGAVTISTNMAGRGTDIRLQEEAAGLGGLYVIGTNRHESRRVDDQLRGRAGRQGEPGSSRFFISLEDPLFVRHGVREFLPPERGGPQDAEAAITDPRVLREIDRAQSIIEAQHHAIRRALGKYSLLVELDRRTVRMLREDALIHGRLPPALEEACPSPILRPRLIRAYLARLDAFWSDHLFLVEEVREGIHLERFAGRDPGLEYIHRVGDAFDVGLRGVEEEVAAACRHAAEDPEALSPEALGVPVPSSTWTYQVSDDVPVAFSLAGASGNIGAAIAAAVVTAITAAAGLYRKLTTRSKGSRIFGRGGSAR